MTTTSTTTTHCWQLDEDFNYGEFTSLDQIKHWKNTLNTYRMMRFEYGALRLEASGSDDWIPGAHLDSKFNLIGDFDIEVWVEDASFTDPGVSNHAAPRLLAMEVGGSANVYVGRGWHWNPSINGFHSGGSATSYLYYADALSEFKLRITRTGSVWKIFVWDTVSEQWEWNGNTSGRTMSETFTGAAMIRIRHDKNAGSKSCATITKFRLNGGACLLGTDFTTSTTSTTTTTTHTTTTITGNTTSTTTTLIFETDFSEYTLDVAPSDWTNRFYTPFQTRTIKAASKSPGNKKFYFQNYDTINEIITSWDDIDNFKDVEILASFRVPYTNGNDPVSLWARASGGLTDENGYYLRFHIGTGLISLIWNDSGTPTYAGNTTHVAHAYFQNRRWLMRFRLRGHKLYGKVWKHGNPEPPDWMVTASDTNITSGGWIGFGGYAANNCNVDCHWFSIATHGGTAQFPSGVGTDGVFSTTTTTTTTTHFWDEDFEGMTIEQPPIDWTETWDTSNVDTLIKTHRYYKVLNLDKTSNAKISVTKDVISKYNVEILALLQTNDSFATFAGGVGARMGGGVATETGYACYMDIANEQIVLRRYNNGSVTLLDTSNFNFQINKWYWIRFRVLDDNIKVRCWQKFDLEPGAWEIDYTDSSPLTSAGEAGVCTFNADVKCDRILVEGWSVNWPIPQPFFTSSTTTFTTTVITTSTTTTHTTTSYTTSTTTTEVSGTWNTNWSEYTSDTSPNDWTEVWESPVAVIIVKDGGQYGAKYLLIDHSTYGHYFSEWDDIGTTKDVDVLAKIQFNDVNPVTGDDYFKIVVRQTGGNNNKNGYEVRLYPENDEVKVYKWVNDTESQVGPTEAFTFTTYWYWVRFQVRGNAIKVKVWVGQPSDEPGTWNIETTDASHADVFGTVGLGSYNGDYTNVDYFAVGVGSSDAPAPSDYLTTTTTTTTTTSTTTTGTTESLMEPPWYTAVGTLQTS